MARRGTKSGRTLGKIINRTAGGGNRKPQTRDGQKTPNEEQGEKKARPAPASRTKKKLRSKPTHTVAETKRQRSVHATHFQQTQGWEVVDVVDGIAIYDDGFKSVHYLNHTAAIVFLLCKTPATMDMMCSVICEEFKLRTRPVKELKAILDQMIKAGLLLTTDATSTKKLRAKTTSNY